jgi:hypothetical protein
MIVDSLRLEALAIIVDDLEALPIIVDDAIDQLPVLAFHKLRETKAASARAFVSVCTTLYALLRACAQASVRRAWPRLQALTKPRTDDTTSGQGTTAPRKYVQTEYMQTEPVTEGKHIKHVNQSSTPT